jgi:tyrosine-protein phosphatase YwqE
LSLVEYNVLTSCEIEGVVAGVDVGCRSEDEMGAEARVQLLQGQTTLVVTQHYLTGSRPRTRARCKIHRTCEKEILKNLL